MIIVKDMQVEEYIKHSKFSLLFLCVNMKSIDICYGISLRRIMMFERTKKIH